MARLTWTTLSFANNRRDLPGRQDRITARARLARLFGRESDPLKEIQREDQHRTEAERRDHAARDAQTQATPAQGRGSRMVANDRPQPVLKPILALARDVDRASFETRWHDERQNAVRADLLQGRDELLKVRSAWDGVLHQTNASQEMARKGDFDGASREMFKAHRRAEAMHKPAMERSTETLNRSETYLSRRSR